MTIRTKQDMYAEIASKFADNANGDISAADLRSVTTDIFDTARWRSFTTLDSNTTLDQNIHNGIIADDSTGNRIFTLPDNATNTGVIFGILKGTSSTNAVVINPAGSDTINGKIEQVLNSFGEYITVVSDGSGQWYIINSNVPKFDAIELSTSEASLPVYKAGQIAYDPDSLTNTSDTGVTGVRVQIGQETHYLVCNNSGVQIDNGSPVYASGVNPTNECFQVNLANASNFFTSAQTLGLATANIPDGSIGLVTTFGAVRNIDTSTLTQGGVVYLGATDGELTNTAPAYPNQTILLGSVLKSDATEGVIWVDVNNITKVPASKSYSFTSQGLSSGEYFVGGFYDASPIEENLNEVSNTVSYGSLLHPYNAHAFIVAGGAGLVDAGQVGLRVNGATFDEATGVLNASDSDIITEDITTLVLNQYAETPKKFLGEIEFELYVVSGSPTTYSLDFNYGYSKYEDVGNADFTIDYIEAVGLAGGNDPGFNIELLHHKPTGWTYASVGFTPGNGVIAGYSADLAPFDNLSAGTEFAWKRDNLNQFIQGSGSEGALFRITTGTNNSVQSVDLHVSGFYEGI